MVQSNQADSMSGRTLPAAILTSALHKGAEFWISAQGEILSTMDAMMGDWMRRRQQAFDTCFQSVKKMCEFRDPVDFVQAQENWLLEAIRLNVSDMRALAADFAILTGNTIGEQRAGCPDDGVLITRGGRSDPGVSACSCRIGERRGAGEVQVAGTPRGTPLVQRRRARIPGETICSSPLEF